MILLTQDFVESGWALRIIIILLIVIAALFAAAIVLTILKKRGDSDEEAADGGEIHTLQPGSRRSDRETTIELFSQEPDTPELPSEIEAANLQGIGMRTEQQDAFGMSSLASYEKDGLFAVLCDGMGGMEHGAQIATDAVKSILSLFPWEDENSVVSAIRNITRNVYGKYRGSGGATLVAVHLKGDRMTFWCVGDSDLLLMRDGTLYPMNMRHEYRNTLLKRSLEGELTIEDAFADPQAAALSEFIGKDRVNVDCTKRPFRLQPGDVLLLCSDGISDTLSMEQIRDLMAMPAGLDVIFRNMEQQIQAAGLPSQDNYTGILLRYRGRSL